MPIMMLEPGATGDGYADYDTELVHGGCMWRLHVKAPFALKGTQISGFYEVATRFVILTPKIPPLKTPRGLKFFWKNKGHKNHPKKPKKARALPFLLARWRQKTVM